MISVDDWSGNSGKAWSISEYSYHYLWEISRRIPWPESACMSQISKRILLHACPMSKDTQPHPLALGPYTISRLMFSLISSLATRAWCIINWILFRIFVGRKVMLECTEHVHIKYIYMHKNNIQTWIPSIHVVYVWQKNI